ncbi:MAG: ADP-dependent NAD(P)H-hydrate dehydratase / NAD(P)H-hydrate epimerase [Kosmotogales bacterium]|nr:ADP-dependent NAD(P)H-hydrate dehydratase / NAD(P)H-hydrate epimerase [Kosmotogales bacterium]
MRVVFPEEMREIDRITVERGVPSLILMEHAARSLFEEIVRTDVLKITILCGAGNNGGDGYALARLLKFCGFDPEVVAIYAPKTKDCKKNVQLFKNSGGSIYRFQKLSKSKLNSIINESELIVDAIFGTGFRGELPGEISELIKNINNLKKAVLAVDTPSGINCENGEVCPLTFDCHKTITFGALKFGQLLFPARNFLGEIIVADTGFPKKVIFENSSINLIHRMMIKNILPPRKADSYKGTYGKVLIIGGSKEYSGAPLLSAMGALRTGAGIVYTYTPLRVQEVIRNKYPEIIASSGEDSDLLIEQDIFQIEKLVREMDVIVLGPGIGRTKNTINLVFKIIELIKKQKKFLVIDADGLYAVSHDINIVMNSDRIVLTPHPGEFKRLIGDENLNLKNNPKYIIEQIKKLKTNVLFKDTISIFTDFSGESWINIHGNTSLSKGGSGDLLSGSIAGFFAQSKDIVKSTILGTYFLGRSAELLDISEAFALPEDVCRGYDRVFNDLLK